MTKGQENLIDDMLKLFLLCHYLINIISHIIKTSLIYSVNHSCIDSSPNHSKYLHFTEICTALHQFTPVCFHSCPKYYFGGLLRSQPGEGQIKLAFFRASDYKEPTTHSS